ncbi:unnamed protein product, partial [Didymodactylos carnosus]
FIVLYIIYLIVLIGGYFINRRIKEQRALLQALQTEAAGSVNRTNYGSIHVDGESINDNQAGNGIVGNCLPDDSYVQPDVTFALSLRKAFLPNEDTPWAEQNCLSKVLTVIKMPVNIILHFTTPIVDYEKPEHNWNKLLNSFHLVSGPVAISLLTQIGFAKINHVFPIWAIVLILGTILCFVVLILTDYHSKPRLHSAFAFLAFSVSVVWVYSIANEIVNLLTAFGIVFNISNTIVGLTFLAWGNSLSDYVSNVVSAKQGYPNMDFLIGLGIPFSIVTIRNGAPFEIKESALQNLIAYFLFGSLVATLIFIPLNKFNYSRWFGFVLVVYYVIFLTMAILIEVKVIF